MKKENKNKCEHCFYPIGYTSDTQVFGTSEDEEVFLNGKGFMLVECGDCGEEGYCILS